MTFLAIHSVLYLYATARIKAGLPAFVAAAAKEGWIIQPGMPERTGWPWSPTIHLHEVSVTRADTPAVLQWTGQHVDLVTPFSDLAALHILPRGAQTIQLSPYRPAELRVVDARFRIPFSADVPITLSFHNVALRAPAIRIQVDEIQGETRIPSMGTAALEITVKGAQLTPSLPPPFGGPITASMQIVANQVACSSPANSLDDFADTVGLRALTIMWGPLRLTATGTGRLDGQCQPSGRAALSVKGGVELIDALAQGGVIALGQASAARTVLSLLTIAAHGGPVTLPIQLTEGTLSVASFPLLRLQPIDRPP